MPKPKSPTLALKRLIRAINECLPTIEAAIERDRQFTEFQKQQAAKPFRDAHIAQYGGEKHFGETPWGMPFAAPTRPVESVSEPEAPLPSSEYQNLMQEATKREHLDWEKQFNSEEAIAARAALEPPERGKNGFDTPIDPWDNETLLAQKLMKG